MKFKRKFFFSFLTVLLTGFIFFIVGELIFRLVVPPPYRIGINDLNSYLRIYHSLVKADQETGLTLRPNILLVKDKDFYHSLTTNSLGFRGKEIDPSKPNILCIGDSHTFGFGVDDENTYPTQLSTLLHNKYNVINMGVFSYSLTNEVALLKRYLHKLTPKIVIFGITVDDLSSSSTSFKNIAPQTEDIFTYRYFKYHSAFIRYLRAYWPNLQIKLGLKKPAHLTYRTQWENEALIRPFRQLLISTVELLEARHVRVILMRYPFPSAVSLMEKGVHPLSKLLMEVAGAHKNTYTLRLLPILEHYYEGMPSLFLEDGHPNERTYKIVATSLFDLIKEGKLLQ